MLKLYAPLKVAMATGEPAQSGVGAFAAGLTAGALALFGVSYLGILWAFFGAAVAVLFSEQTDRRHAWASVIGGTITGAGLGDLLYALMMAMATDWQILKTVPTLAQGMHIGLSLVIGAGAKVILGALIAAVVSRIAKAGGQP